MKWLKQKEDNGIEWNFRINNFIWMMLMIPLIMPLLVTYSLGMVLGWFLTFWACCFACLAQISMEAIEWLEFANVKDYKINNKTYRNWCKNQKKKESEK